MGVLAEISMRAKLVRSRLRADPDSVDRLVLEVERLEDELLDAMKEFGVAVDR